MENITVSVLPNITFYSGADARTAGQAVENRQYGTVTDSFGELCLSRDYNSYWNGQGIGTSTFGENPTKYNNIGDIVNATITYMDKFKGNEIDIKVEKNILTFEYDFENDLDSNYDNTHIIPSTVLLDLLLNMNDMKFNKLNYYKNNYELKEVSYLHKKYPYNPEGTVFTAHEGDTITNYDFSRQFTDFKYTEIEHEITYEGHIMREVEQEDGSISYIPTEQTYTGIRYEYSYIISDINPLKDRIESFFENNSEAVEEARGDMKTYFISDLNSVITLSLNTYSLGNKNLYAYFNFNSKFNNWYDNLITFNTDILDENSSLDITPANENFFGVNKGTESLSGGDRETDTKFTVSLENENENQQFNIINPSNIKELDFTGLKGKVFKLDLINQYAKKLNVYESGNTNWIIEGGCRLESIKLGDDNISDNELRTIKGINSITTLKNIDITNCDKLDKNLQINKLVNLNNFKAKGSNITSFVPKKGLTFDTITLPNTLNTLTLKEITASNFDYTPNENLINLTLEDVVGIDTQSLVKTWVDKLTETNTLYDGIITNTNLKGINWTNYEVPDMLKLRYLGLNKFEGNISIKGSGNNNVITRKEYLQLRNVFGDEIMVCGKYSSNSKPIKFQYTLDPLAFKKQAKFFYYDDIVINGETISTKIEDTSMTFEFNMLDTTGGHSFLDYIATKDKLELTKNKEAFGYEIKLDKKIYTDNNDSSSLTKSITAGDVILYKGNTLIFVYKTTTTVYNYTKIGRFLFTNSQHNKIEIEFI